MRRLRIGIDSFSGALLLIGLFTGWQLSSIASFWSMSWAVFPYPQWAQRLRSQPGLHRIFILLGVGIIGLSWYWRRTGLPAGVFSGLQLLLAGLWQRSYLKRRPEEELSASVLWLGLSSLAAGLAGLALTLR